ERRREAIALRSEVIPVEAKRILDELTDALEECATSPGSVDALERADRESEISDWLETLGLNDGCLAGELVEAGMERSGVEPLALWVTGDLLRRGLRILAFDAAILCLSREVEEASTRISSLVQAVKQYSYMDRTPVAEVDVEEGIDVTLRMFTHQLKHGYEVK